MHKLDESEVQRRTRNLAALLELGFESAAAPDPEPTLTEIDPIGRNRVRVSQALPAMGTVVSVSVLDESADRALERAAAAYAEMHRTIDLFNRYDDASALGVLNSCARLRAAPPEFIEVLRRAQFTQAASNGAFDMTVAPVIDVFRDHRERGLAGPPDSGLIDAARARVNATGVAIHGHDVRLRDGVSVTLDGIAKGYIVDRMAAAVDEAEGFLINAGGDVRTGGTRDGDLPWQVGVRNPESPDAELDVLPLFAGAVATSGSYEIYFDRERTQHHIVNAFGVSPGDCLAVTVRAPSATFADSLATAAFVAGPGAGLRTIESVPGCSGLIVDATGRQHTTKNWRPGAGTPNTP